MLNLPAIPDDMGRLEIDKCRPRVVYWERLCQEPDDDRYLRHSPSDSLSQDVSRTLLRPKPTRRKLLQAEVLHCGRFTVGYGFTFVVERNRTILPHSYTGQGVPVVLTAVEDQEPPKVVSEQASEQYARGLWDGSTRSREDPPNASNM